MSVDCRPPALIWGSQLSCRRSHSRGVAMSVFMLRVIHGAHTRSPDLHWTLYAIPPQRPITFASQTQIACCGRAYAHHTIAANLGFSPSARSQDLFYSVHLGVPDRRGKKKTPHSVTKQRPGGGKKNLNQTATFVLRGTLALPTPRKVAG
jgi:hypothetical protein